MFWLILFGTLLLLFPAFAICMLSQELMRLRNELDMAKREPGTIKEK